MLNKKVIVLAVCMLFSWAFTGIGHYVRRKSIHIPQKDRKARKVLCLKGVCMTILLVIGMYLTLRYMLG